MYKKSLFYFLIVFLLSACQVSLISSLPGWFSNLNLILVSLVYAIGLSKKVFIWCLMLGAGLFLDLILFSPFGLYSLGIIVTALAVYSLHINFLTDQSLYTYIVLVITATVVFRVWAYLFYSVSSFFLNDNNYLALNNIFWLNQIWALILNVIFTGILFYFFTFISRRLTPVFLMPKTK